MENQRAIRLINIKSDLFSPDELPWLHRRLEILGQLKEDNQTKSKFPPFQKKKEYCIVYTQILILVAT